METLKWLREQGTKKLGMLLGTFGDKGGIVDIATETVDGADEENVKNLIEGVLKAISRTITKVSQDLILATIKNITMAIINATLNTVGGLPVVKKAVFGNDINETTFKFIWSNGVVLAYFLIEFLEPAKQYALAKWVPGDSPPENERGPYNELDLTDPMNRHGVISQVQRLFKSIVIILTGHTREVGTNDIGFTVDTRLLSDDGTPSTVLERSNKPVDGSAKLDESWIFVNGIATEYYWLRLACKKLADKFSRTITGVHNRSDGILWDLVECSGERSTKDAERLASQRSLTLRTPSSKAAQDELLNQLKVALVKAHGEKKGGKLVVIAHSQGCLLLRLVLEDLLVRKTPLLLDSTSAVDEQNYHEIRALMRKDMYVFTFGNSSVDWKIHSSAKISIPEQPGGDNLSDYFCRTEHFANETDFVAKLGVLSPERPADSGYSNVFVNSDSKWTGHLFASQYSLDAMHYRDEQGNSGDNSRLLRCPPGKSIV